jgi:hypothetical protein
MQGDGTASDAQDASSMSIDGSSAKTSGSFSGIGGSLSSSAMRNIMNAPGDEMSRIHGDTTGNPADNAAQFPDSRALHGVAALPASSDGSSVQNFEPFPVAFGSPADHVEQEDDSMKHEEDEQQELDRKPSAK